MFPLIKLDFTSHLTSQFSPSMRDCSEKPILAKQINDCLYLYTNFNQMTMLGTLSFTIVTVGGF